MKTLHLDDRVAFELGENEDGTPLLRLLIGGKATHINFVSREQLAVLEKAFDAEHAKLATVLRTLGRDLEDSKVEELLRPWKAQVASLKEELEEAELRARVSEDALRKRIAELAAEVARLTEQSEPSGGPIYSAPFRRRRR